MKISAGPDPATPAAQQNPPSPPQKSTNATTESATREKVSAAAVGSAADVQRQTNVTLRRDTNGRVYYVVSDAKSGQEILEVPPKELRDVGQGIEDYLKEQQSKAGSHVEVKA